MAATKNEARNDRSVGTLLEELPTGRLAEQARDLMSAAGERALSVAGEKATDLTDRLLDYVENGPAQGGSLPVRMLLGAGKAGLTGLVGGGGSGGKGGGKKLKLTNIVEEIDVGVPVRVAYNQWTQFQDFPKFTKRVESVEQESDDKLTWKAGIFLSHRTWESTIVEQVPDELIVWHSKGQKGRVDGTVTFHELAPNLTRILLVLEYHPQGLFERTGNLWRAQGRRTRLELKHFRRHLMTQTILDPDGAEGWRGEIHDGEVVRTHDEAVEDEAVEDEETDTDDRADGEDDEEPVEAEEWADDEEPEDDGELDEFSDEDGGDEEQTEPPSRSRTRRSAARSR